MIPSQVVELLQDQVMVGDDKPAHTVNITHNGTTRELGHILSIDVQKSQTQGGKVVIVADNRGARYSPDNSASDWHEHIWLNAVVEVDQGYGTNQARTFMGLIDDVDMENFPATITITARDMWKQALDQTITDTEGERVVPFVDEPAEDIFRQLAIWAGWDDGDITTEETGVTIEEVTFDHESYANGMEWLSEITGFEIAVGDDGTLAFRYATDRQPEEVDDDVVLTGTDWAELAHSPIVRYSERVHSAPGGGGTEYTLDVDYEIDLSGGRIRRLTGGSIGSGSTVYVTYVYAAWVFTEGQDLIQIGYRLSDDDIYRRALVHTEGDDGETLEGEGVYLGRDYYNVLPHKVLRVPPGDMTHATQEMVDEIAARMAVKMQTKPRIVRWAAPANPWIRVGDCVQVIETSSTISEIYRITDISFSRSVQGFFMEIAGHYYGYAPLEV